MASFDDYVAVAKNITNKRIVGIYPETKIPSFFNDFLSSHNTTVEDILLDSLQKYGYTQNTSPCFIQSFSEDSITYMSTRTNLPLIFLTTVSITDSKMTELSSFCYGIGTSKETIVQADRSNSIFRTTDFIERAHEHDLKVKYFVYLHRVQCCQNNSIKTQIRAKTKMRLSKNALLSKRSSSTLKLNFFQTMYTFFFSKKIRIPGMVSKRPRIWSSVIPRTFKWAR